ncbi:CsiV family protein [Pseudomonas sp. 2835]|uniref:CsiV family protein n=1 Tax=Pseudomonas sp. 2835 TaxID=3156451 RepID=UPI003D1DC98D
MRVMRSLTLLLALIAPAAFADGAFQVEMILFRQNAVPAIPSPAAEDWRNGAQAIPEGDLRQPALNDEAAKLAADPNQYTVLLHKAWKQDAGTVAISDGEEHFGQFPIAGNLSIKEERFIDAEANFWVNQFDGNGSVLQSEAFKQSNKNIKNGELTFLDGGPLALLLKVTSHRPVSAPAAPAEMMEQ